MHSLRRSRFIARLALAWFALLLVAGVAAPVVHPQALELICTAGGPPKFIVAGSDGDVLETPVGQHSLDCPLCLAAVLPVALGNAWGRMPVPGPMPPLRAYESWISAIRAAALPARGPPAANPVV